MAFLLEWRRGADNKWKGLVNYRWEQPHDLLLSTLNSYLQAIGGTARMIVSFADGHETTLDPSELA
jgi:hypothetical protein